MIKRFFHKKGREKIFWPAQAPISAVQFFYKSLKAKQALRPEEPMEQFKKKIPQ